eukprot:GFUD01045082.1.p1 GENE.GFUD01045082.1~~GFUD01045082.1.p1  ORF type:complete len:263 (+),score=53.78 GFUD01045082.1:295-1083(+)
MSSYHKPKIYRSVEGCCICKAKSSSSRFTDSDKYENEFSNCFKLEESRFGDICNACVLIVKRWRNLPKDTKKNWAHVVNARNGPGNKQSTRQKKKEEQIEKFEKIRKKRKNKIVFKRPIAGNSQVASVKENTTSNPFNVPDFIDLSYWKRSVICCGVIYQGECGEVMVDQRFFRRCLRHSESRSHEIKPVLEPVKLTVNEPEPFAFDDSEDKSYDEDSDSISFYSDTDSNFSKFSQVDLVPNVDTDGDEGFFDKSDIVRHLI